MCEADMKCIHHEYLTPDTTDVLKPSRHIPPLPTSQPLSGSSACKPTKSLHYHKLTQHAALVKVQMRATFKSPQTALRTH